jgi:hypothetical protein
MSLRRLALAALAAGLLLSGCHQAKPGGPGVLLLKVEPTKFKPGAIVTVSAKPPQGSVLAQVSGTVAVMGAPTVPFQFDGVSKAWVFRTLIPDMVTIPPGDYQVKAWGADKAGRRYEGSTTISVQ